MSRSFSTGDLVVNTKVLKTINRRNKETRAGTLFAYVGMGRNREDRFRFMKIRSITTGRSSCVSPASVRRAGPNDIEVYLKRNTKMKRFFMYWGDKTECSRVGCVRGTQEVIVDYNSLAHACHDGWRRVEGSADKWLCPECTKGLEKVKRNTKMKIKRSFVTGESGSRGLHCSEPLCDRGPQGAAEVYVSQGLAMEAGWYYCHETHLWQCPQCQGIKDVDEKAEASKFGLDLEKFTDSKLGEPWTEKGADPLDDISMFTEEQIAYLVKRVLDAPIAPEPYKVVPVSKKISDDYTRDSSGIYTSAGKVPITGKPPCEHKYVWVRKIESLQARNDRFADIFVCEKCLDKMIVG